MRRSFMLSILKPVALAFVLILTVSILPALTLINENIQSWTAYTSYGNYTQAIPAGNVSMSFCMVSPGAAATGTCSIGRIQMQATTGVVEFPQLASVGSVEFHFAAGSSGRTVKLQKLNGTTWEDITTFTGISATGATYTYDVNLSETTIIRLAAPSNALYVHDIIVTDYQMVELPIVTTTAAYNITYNTALSGGNVENIGATALNARGVCWSTVNPPTIDDSFTNDGTGIGTYVSNLTGLNPDTDYFVRAYATNGSGTSYGEVMPFRTANIGVPSTQASSLVLYPGTTSIQATWTPGNGAKRVVKINNANSFTNPVNGQDYPANPIYNGTGEQVVYNGATQIVEGVAINAVSVTGLAPNTNYWLRVFDYNGEGVTTLYNTSTAPNNPRSTTTLNSSTNNYYNGISGSGASLKSALHILLRNTHLTEFSYDGVWTQLQYTDEDSTNTNNIIEEYTGWSVPKSYNGGGTSQWNREHTWSKSHGDFGETAPAGTDLHHLRPADSTVNSSKGNKDFDDGGSAVIDSSPYTGYSGTTGCYTDTDSWEPRAVEKGDIARMILYMAVRYDGDDTSYDLEMQDATPTSGPFYGKLSTLLKWHVQDPPDSWERRRNNRIQERQGNRNPFIDHPEYVNMIWAPTATEPTLTDSITFTAHWTPAVNATSYYLDVAADSLFTSFVSGYQNLNVGSVTSRNITVPASNQNYYYRLRSFFTIGYSMYSNVAAVYLSSAPVIYAAFNTSWSANEEIGYYIDLSWTTSYEHNLAGFNLYRSLTRNLTDASNVTPQLIPAANTGTSHVYTYRDGYLNSWTWYYYWIKSINLDNSYQFYGPDSCFVGEVANDDQVDVPVVPIISKIYPNPFRNIVSIELSLSKAESVTISVYNLKGQLVRTIFKGNKAAGTQSLNWDGKDMSGRACSPGIYLVRLQSDSGVNHKKLVLD